MGLRWSADFGADVARRVLGRGALAAACGGDARKAGVSVVRRTWRTSATPQQLLRRWPRRPTSSRADFGKLEDAVGRHQPLPAADRRHRPAVQRRRAEHSGRLHVRRGGARWRRSARAPTTGTKKMVRHQRQQLRRGGRVRRRRVRARAVTAGGESGDPDVAALQRSGEALQHGRLARGATSTARNSRDISSGSIIPVSENRESDLFVAREGFRRA